MIEGCNLTIGRVRFGDVCRPVVPTDVTEVVPASRWESSLRNPRGPHGELVIRTGLRPTGGDGAVGVAWTDVDDGERLHEGCRERAPAHPSVASMAPEYADATADVRRGNRLANEAR